VDGYSSACRGGGLVALEARVRHDLEILDYPREPWISPTCHPSGRHVYDVAICGAGQGGLAAAFALRREQVRNVFLFDAGPAGREGPWVTYARMRTLRTPKYLSGPEMGVPSLSYRAWHEAQPHLASWDSLERISRARWMDYLVWFRRAAGLAVENETRLLGIAGEASGLLALAVERRGRAETVLARKLVLANGMDGAGAWHVPPEIAAAVPPRLRRHTAEETDFAELEGKRIGIVGIGASAVDNAAVALECGAAGVDLFCRRGEVPQAELRAWLENNGFLRHFAELDDARRWRVMRRLYVTGAPPPAWSLERALGLGARVHVAAPWQRVACEGEEVRVTTPRGAFVFDRVILATGLVTDLALRPELASLAPLAATWADRYTPPAEEVCEPVSRHPYLGRGFELTERVPGTEPWLRHVHLFNWGATTSLGVTASSITGMKFGVPRLVAAITGEFYRAIADVHAAAMPWQEPE
jgi:hypothetical protein